MSGLFDACCSCSGPLVSTCTIFRVLGGFSEYTPTPGVNDANPVTWFLGSRYKTATLSGQVPGNSSATCGYSFPGGFCDNSAQNFDYDIDYTFTSEYSEYINQPSNSFE